MATNICFSVSFMPTYVRIRGLCGRSYRMHQRSAPRYRLGRVVLAGDAAHVTNPTGGLGREQSAIPIGEILPDGLAPDLRPFGRHLVEIARVAGVAHVGEAKGERDDPAGREQR